jgi:hypothetical protein
MLYPCRQTKQAIGDQMAGRTGPTSSVVFGGLSSNSGDGRLWLSRPVHSRTSRLPSSLNSVAKLRRHKPPSTRSFSRTPVSGGTYLTTRYPNGGRYWIPIPRPSHLQADLKLEGLPCKLLTELRDRIYTISRDTTPRRNASLPLLLESATRR